MPCVRRHLRRWHPPPMLPVAFDDGDARPFRASPADRVFSRLEWHGEMTVPRILDVFEPDEWVGAERALDGLVGSGRVAVTIYRRGKTVELATYSIKH